MQQITEIETVQPILSSEIRNQRRLSSAFPTQYETRKYVMR